RAARPIVERICALLAALDRPRPWRAQAAQLRRLAEALGLDVPGDDALDHLANALDDHGAVLEGLGQGDRPWDWGEFTAAVEALARDLEVPAPAPPPGTIRVTTVDAVEGARARHVLLANLTEG